jgi:hypothetical protein
MKRAQRTTDRRYDYKWGSYESVVKSIFLRLVAEHPVYVLQSIFFYEPLAIVSELFTGQFVPPLGALIIVFAASAICAFVLLGRLDLSGSVPLALAALMFFAMSLLPALASGVMPLRLVEPAFLLYAWLADGCAFSFATCPCGTRAALRNSPDRDTQVTVDLRSPTLVEVDSLRLVRPTVRCCRCGSGHLTACLDAFDWTLRKGVIMSYIFQKPCRHRRHRADAETRFNAGAR